RAQERLRAEQQTDGQREPKRQQRRSSERARQGEPRALEPLDEGALAEVVVALRSFGEHLLRNDLDDRAGWAGGDARLIRVVGAVVALARVLSNAAALGELRHARR